MSELEDVLLETDPRSCALWHVPTKDSGVFSACATGLNVPDTEAR